MPGNGTPVVHVFARSRCGHCYLYAAYLRRAGLDVEVRPLSDARASNLPTRVPPALHSEPVAVVDHLVLMGHVPAAEIRRSLERDRGGRVRALIVLHRPRGAPGLISLSPEPYAVHVLYAEGFMQPGPVYIRGEPAQ